MPEDDGTIGTRPRSAETEKLLNKMHLMVKRQLNLHTVLDIHPMGPSQIGFVLGDKSEAKRMAQYFQRGGVLGKVIPLRDRKRTLVVLNISE